MSELSFFDLNGITGEPLFDPEAGGFSGYGDAASLESRLDEYGVDFALVSHYRAFFGAPMAANASLSRELAGRSRLFPCWCLLPGHTGETPSGRELATQLRDHGVRAVRLPIGAYNLPLDPWVLEGLLGILEEQRMLTIFQLPTLGVAVPDRDDLMLRGLREVLDRHPSLPVVTAARLRGLYPLLEAFENLYVSMEWDPHPEFVEDVCRRFGGGRLLFATPYSENARGISGMPMLTITHADVSEEDKRRVAGGNLGALLGIEVGKEGPPAAAARAARGQAAMREGRPLPYRIIDIHAHVGPWSWEHKPAAGLEAMLGEMDRLGVELACVSSTEAVLGGDHVRGNRELAEQIRTKPNRFAGFAVINPHFADQGAYAEECVGRQGFRGIKIHPRTHRCSVVDPKYRCVWEASERHRLPVLCHTGEGQAFSEPSQFRDIAPAYPRGVFILGHAGETFAGIQQCIELAAAFQNVYLDLSGWGFMNRGYLEFLLRRVDPRRVLFGSDYSWIDLRYAAGTVLFARIGEESKRMIFGENARRILDEVT
jgi:predicted TIM-barrel fold metal-dependent hydrolase